MEQNKWKPFGSNIRVRPLEKKFIASTPEGNLLEIGEVEAIGDEVKKVKVGDLVSCWLVGVKSPEHEDGSKHHLILENDHFILEVLEKNDR